MQHGDQPDLECDSEPERHQRRGKAFSEARAGEKKSGKPKPSRKQANKPAAGRKRKQPAAREGSKKERVLGQTRRLFRGLLGESRPADRVQGPTH
jgi:hypothetical protein